MADDSKLADDETKEANARLVADAAAQLVESAQDLDKASRLLPTDEDFHFLSNFSEFREPLRGIAARVHESLSKFSSIGMVSRAPPLPSDHDDLADWLVSMQDELLEQVDSAFDLFKKERAQQGLSPPENDAFMYQNTRKKRRRDMPARKEINTPLEGEGKAVSMQVEKCPVPFHVWSIPRPQDKFDIPVDNSNTPFRHPRPPSRSLQDAEPYVSTHPLSEELKNMSFEGWLVNLAEIKQPASLEETPFTFVNTPSLLEETAAKLALENEIAVDLEHHHFRSFQGLTCLMQVSTRSEDFIIDTLELRNIIGRHLYDVFASPSIQKVMHGASFDVLWLQRDFGIYLCGLFDTGQAARVLDLESFGLAHLLTQFCGFTPDKRYQMADWRLRPLPMEMIKYAREDTHYLLYIADVLKQKLLSLQTTNQESMLEEVRRRSRDICSKLYEKEITTETSYLQVHGLEAKKFNSQQLAVLSGLYSWRDQIARTEDESTGYVLPNHLLLKLAEEMPDDVKMLRTMLNGRHTLVARNSATIVNIIKTMKLLPQRPMKECTFNPEDGINKSSALFEEHPFPEPSTVAAVIEEERNNNVDSSRQSCIIADRSEVQGNENSLQQVTSGISGFNSANLAIKAGNNLASAANAVVNRATRSSLFGMQKTRNKASDKSKVLKDADFNNASTRGENSHELNFSGDASASSLEVRASGSSLFCKANKMNQVIHDMQDTPGTAENGTLEAARTNRQESLLGNRTTLQLKVNSNLQTEDIEQAEAKSRVEIVRASFSLPFYAFDGRDSCAQVHRKSTAEQVFNKEQGPESGLQDNLQESELLEAEDVILLDTNTNDDTVERGAEEPTCVVRKGIGITSDGVQHRLWWPNTTGSALEPSLDKMEPESFDLANSSIISMELPVPLSQRYKSHRGNSQNNSVSSQVSNFNANDSCKEEPKSFEHTDQMQTRFTPFEYEAAKKNIGLFRVHHGTDESAERSNFSQPATQQVFDPKKSIKEFKPEGIAPGKRRQVFPQSGNRTGVFK